MGIREEAGGDEEWRQGLSCRVPWVPGGQRLPCLPANALRTPRALLVQDSVSVRDQEELARGSWPRCRFSPFTAVRLCFPTFPDCEREGVGRSSLAQLSWSTRHVQPVASRLITHASEASDMLDAPPASAIPPSRSNLPNTNVMCDADAALVRISQVTRRTDPTPRGARWLDVTSHH